VRRVPFACAYVRHHDIVGHFDIGTFDFTRFLVYVNTDVDIAHAFRYCKCHAEDFRLEKYLKYFGYTIVSSAV
jgi:hypothetical protein